MTRKSTKSYIHFTSTWSEKTGRWNKRRLSKARRKYIKVLLLKGRARYNVGIESEVNWKGH